MSFQGVDVTKSDGNLGRSGVSTDDVMALVAFSAASADADFNSVNELNSVKMAEDLGIDAAFDANETVLTHNHVDEFFRLAPNGTLKLVVTDKTTAKQFFESAAAKAMFREHTDVKRIAFVYNDDVAGLNLPQEIAACQLFVNELFADKIYLDGIYLEARNTGKAGINRRTLNSPNVSLVIAQDPGVAAIDPAYAKYAAVGSALGMRAARKVNENLGSVDIINKPNAKKGTENYSLTDELLGLWLSSALSDGSPVKPLTEVEQKALTANGYIFAGSFQGYPGVYFNGEPTCTLISSDYSTGENNGVWNKAALGVRNALIPKVRGWFQRNPGTGKLRDTAITDLENIGSKPLNKMVANSEISGYTLTIPAGQNPTDQTPLIVKGSVTLGAIVHTFELNLSLA